ncbi:MAG: hypothetical protein ACQEP9_07520 [Bacillota bacterium]
MQKKLVTISSLLIMMIALAGCLVQDDSMTMMGSEEKSEVKDKAREITDDFFKYNSYDPSTNSEYNAQELIDLFDQSATGDIVTIDPIIGGQYGKGLTDLEAELKHKETLFAAFESQLDNDRFNYNSYKLTFDYESIFNDDEIDGYTAVYRIKFRVFEEINGELIATPTGVPEGVTDNGVIEVHLSNEIDGWKVTWMKVDFQNIGNISL